MLRIMRVTVVDQSGDCTDHSEASSVLEISNHVI